MQTLRRLVKGAAVAGGLALLPVSAAMADTTLESANNACTTGSIQVCLSFSLIQIGTSSSQTYSLELKLLSLQGSAPGATTGFSDFGLLTSASGTFTAGNACAGGTGCPDAGWGIQIGSSGPNCSDLSPDAAAICDNNNGAKGHDIEFTFNFTGTASALSSANVIAHVQGIGTCSGKTQTTGAGVTTFYAAPGDGTAASCGLGPVTSTPEPASLALMGTGLIGLGGLGFRRRRRS